MLLDGEVREELEEGKNPGAHKGKKMKNLNHCPSVGWAIQKNLTDTLYSSAVKALAKCRPSPGGVIALGGKGPVEHAGPSWEIGFSPI